MLVRLKSKLAEVVNGLDLSRCSEGDVIDVNDTDSRMLIAEGWGEPIQETEAIASHPKRLERAVAADDGCRGWRKTSSNERWPEGHRFMVAPPPNGGPGGY